MGLPDDQKSFMIGLAV